MRCLLCTTVVFLLPIAAWAEEKTKPNALSPKEFAEGWIMLFDGKTKFGWKIDGEAMVKDGALILGGEKATTATTTTAFGNFEMKYDIRGKGKGGATVGVVSQDGKLEGTLRLGTKDHFQTRDLRSPSGKQSQWQVRFIVPAGTEVHLRNIELKPGGLQQIFNGKDLSGWKEIKTDRTKSKFSVTDKGELNIKNGPGDIQTEGQWADFVLQVEVFSNGPHLNSGVFFRCIPDKFWSGYEAQIRNEWVSDVILKDGTKLTGSYNPKVSEVSVRKGRQVTKVKVNKGDIKEVIDHRDQPIDFGTGAIYNRQKARKVVSSDHEWFTMTVIANGKHLAVWVNGYQTADFTDKRKPNDNARQGAKTAKGPVSLQGHDPTTDLRFRHIRIVELPQEKK
jgi:Domain of Unknown Function (DUF1080)